MSSQATLGSVEWPQLASLPLAKPVLVLRSWMEEVIGSTMLLSSAASASACSCRELSFSVAPIDPYLAGIMKRFSFMYRFCALNRLSLLKLLPFLLPMLLLHLFFSLLIGRQCSTSFMFCFDTFTTEILPAFAGDLLLQGAARAAGLMISPI